MELAEVLYLIGTYTLVTLPFVAVGGLLIAFPVSVILRRLRFTSAPVLLLAGAVAGGLASLLISLGFEQTIEALFWCAAIGVLPGAVAGLIWHQYAERTDAGVALSL